VKNRLRLDLTSCRAPEIDLWLFIGYSANALLIIKA
jgi:hypothetical protein